LDLAEASGQFKVCAVTTVARMTGELLYRQAAQGCHSAAAQTAILRWRKALPMTETELKLIASAAISGDSSRPVNGYSSPAASGTPRAL
jgi:hypothetical protein